MLGSKDTQAEQNSHRKDQQALHYQYRDEQQTTTS